MIDIQTRRLPANRMLVSRCVLETQTHEIQLPEGTSQEQFEQDVAAWLAGELIQNALGYLHAQDREFLVSGITPARWNELFAELPWLERRFEKGKDRL